MGRLADRATATGTALALGLLSARRLGLSGAAPAVAAPARTGERETREPIKGVRKMMAQAMVDSAFTAPHVTEWVTVDATRTMRLVERLKEHRDFRDVKVSPLLVVARACILAARRTPDGAGRLGRDRNHPDLEDVLVGVTVQSPPTKRAPAGWAAPS